MESKDNGLKRASMGPCDVCGKPATHVVRDYMPVKNQIEGFETYEPTAYLKKGCDEHPVKSVLVEYRET